jgi:hypothetical protein
MANKVTATLTQTANTANHYKSQINLGWFNPTNKGIA